MSVSKLNQILNISSREWPRVLVAWSMMLLTRFGFIVGWTVLIATFLSKIGIEFLPLLFLINAILVMLGTLIYRRIIHKIRRELLIVITILAAAALLITSIGFIQSNTTVFFALLISAESVLLAQLTILLSLFNEELFTPLESQRTFPIIESAETIGAILGGLTLSIFANSIPAYKFIIIWALALLLILPIVLKYNSNTMDVPKLEIKEEKKERTKLFHNFNKIRKIPFLKGMLVVIILYWGMMNMVEFQYTKAIQQEVYSVQEQTLVLNAPQDNGIVLASNGYTETQSDQYEKQIAEKLGSLHVIFSSAALLIQLIIASRILTYLGVVSSVLLHPLITFLNLIGLTLRFGFVTAALTRGSYELTGLIFKNAYDSSYYAIPLADRDDVKELMQGIMKPLGAILGTLGIIIIAFKFSGSTETLYINILLMIMAVVMMIIVGRLGEKYTAISEQNLSRKNDLPTRLNAIEILAQKGHGKNTPSLRKLLEREDEPEVLKRSILNTLGAKQDHESIDAILKTLSHDTESLRMAAIQALVQFEQLKRKKNMHQSFTRYRVIETLKDRIKEEENEIIREKIVVFLHEIAPEEVTKFLVELINNGTEKSAAYIRMMKLFKDPNLKYFLEPYLNHQSAELKAASIIALWQFEEMQATLAHHLKQMMKSKKSSVLVPAIAACGEVKYKELKEDLRLLLESEYEIIHEAAMLALAQMEDENVSEKLVKYFTDPKHKWFEDSKSIIETFPKRFAEKIKALMHMQIIEKINHTLAECPNIEEMEIATLNLLKSLYHKIDAHQEAYKIKNILDSSR